MQFIYLFCYRTGAVVSEIPYLIEPSKPAITDEQVECDSILPDDFDLKKFNQCVPERRAVLDHPNKEITVCTLKFILRCFIL